MFCSATPCLSQQATNWPEADRLFRGDPFWLGGDAAFSIDLGKGKVLWLFGDSFIAPEKGANRAGSRMIRNSVAIQRGYDPSHAKLQFYWKKKDCQAQSFFPEMNKCWLWPLHGIKIGSKLMLFFNVMESDQSPKSLGFKGLGAATCWIDNADDSPKDWHWQQPTLISNDWNITLGSSLLRSGDYVYVFGFDEPDHHVYVARIASAQIAEGSLSGLTWWSRRDNCWKAQSELKGRPEPLFDDGATEFSVSYDEKGQRYVEVQSLGFGASKIVMREAKNLTGPWSGSAEIFTPPESLQAYPFVYAGKMHSELSGADMVVTYATNGDLKRLVEDMSIYFPRFVRVQKSE